MPRTRAHLALGPTIGAQGTTCTGPNVDPDCAISRALCRGLGTHRTRLTTDSPSERPHTTPLVYLRSEGRLALPAIDAGVVRVPVRIPAPELGDVRRGDLLQ